MKEEGKDGSEKEKIGGRAFICLFKDCECLFFGTPDTHQVSDILCECPKMELHFPFQECTHAPYEKSGSNPIFEFTDFIVQLPINLANLNERAYSFCSRYSLFKYSTACPNHIAKVLYLCYQGGNSSYVMIEQINDFSTTTSHIPQIIMNYRA